MPLASSKLPTLEFKKVLVRATVALRRFPQQTSLHVYRTYKNCHLGACCFLQSAYKNNYISVTMRPYRPQIFCEASHSFVFAKASVNFSASNGPFSHGRSHFIMMIHEWISYICGNEQLRHYWWFQRMIE